MQEVQQFGDVQEVQTEAPPVGEARQQEVQRVAGELFRQEPDWVTFFREVLGVDGVVRRLFPTPEELEEFQRTGQYADIQQMLAQLRGRNGAAPETKEPTRVITVRMPQSLHETLRTQAHEKKTSMNKLCISKLLQVVEDELIPAE